MPYSPAPGHSRRRWLLDPGDGGVPNMRVFSIGSDGEFTEYEQLPFKMDHEESVLEEWLEFNPDGILEDGQILIIGR